VQCLFSSLASAAAVVRAWSNIVLAGRPVGLPTKQQMPDRRADVSAASADAAAAVVFNGARLPCCKNTVICY